MADPLAGVVAALAGSGLDGRTVADAIWLATAMARAQPAPADDVVGGTEEPEPRTRADETRPTGEPEAPDREEAPVYERTPLSTDERVGVAVGVPKAGSLGASLDFVRALRPFRRPWRDGVHRRLDIDATVDEYAATGVLVPVMVPEPERWFDVVVVVDDSVSMAVWRDEVAAFVGLLRGMGVFRAVGTWRLAPDGGLTDERDVPLTDPTRAVRVPGARRLVLVVSDFAHPAWRRAPLWTLVRSWAAHTPTALVDPMPVRLWRHSGLDFPMVRATATDPGARSPDFAYRLPLRLRVEGGRDHLPVPAVPFTGPGLARWASALMRSDPAGCDAVLVPPHGRTASGGAGTGTVDIATAIDSFTHTASPAAIRLGALCSPFTRFGLPLLHLLRESAVEDAGLTDVAEFLTSGLLRVADTTRDPVLTFREGAATALRDHLPRHDAWRAFDAITRRVADHTDRQDSLAALAEDPDGAHLRAESHPFAQAAEDLRLALTGPTDSYDPFADPPTLWDGITACPLCGADLGTPPATRWRPPSLRLETDRTGGWRLTTFGTGHTRASTGFNPTDILGTYRMCGEGHLFPDGPDLPDRITTVALVGGVAAGKSTLLARTLQQHLTPDSPTDPDPVTRVPLDLLSLEFTATSRPTRVHHRPPRFLTEWVAPAIVPAILALHAELGAPPDVDGWGSRLRQPVVKDFTGPAGRVLLAVVDLPGGTPTRPIDHDLRARLSRNAAQGVWVVDPTASDAMTRFLPTHIPDEKTRRTRESDQDRIGWEFAHADQSRRRAHRPAAATVAVTKADLIATALTTGRTLHDLGHPGAAVHGTARYLLALAATGTPVDPTTHRSLITPLTDAAREPALRTAVATHLATGILDAFSTPTTFLDLVDTGHAIDLRLPEGHPSAALPPRHLPIPTLTTHLTTALDPAAPLGMRDAIMSALTCGIMSALGLSQPIEALIDSTSATARLILCMPLGRAADLPPALLPQPPLNQPSAGLRHLLATLLRG